ncbi:MAG TPA: putative lipid II flippase FtsW [Firmicutes bacterium]|nr:putative lipid II flippase FtsW [Candidatus Fermentithermobacillaceae bacterium]
MIRGKPDYVLFFTVLTLLALGIVMVFSASFVRAERFYGSRYYFLVRQIIWAVIGTTMMMFFINFDCWRLRPVIPYLYGLSLLLLVLVLIPGIGKMANEARRWIELGPVNLQPAELSKLTTLLFMADSLARKRERVRGFWSGLFPYLVLLGLTFALILAEPDLGTAVAVAASAGVMVFVAGANMWHLALVGTGAVPVLIWAIMSSEYRRERFFAFLDPWKDPMGSGFQIIQALYALGSGHIFGTGVAYSRQKYFYLPEPHTDFIFAIIGEELGFIGSFVVLLSFFVIAWRGYRTALAAPDRFSCILAAGTTSLLVGQAIVNIGVVTGCLPITGIPLPFLSYGGSSLVISLVCVGILLNISRYAGR